MLLEVIDNDLDSSRDIYLVRLDVKFRVGRSFVRSRDSGEIYESFALAVSNLFSSTILYREGGKRWDRLTFDNTGPRLFVETFRVSFLYLLERGIYEHFEERDL